MTKDYFLFEGIPIMSQFISVESLSFARDKFLVRDDDVIIVTYPRSGTHWMIEILSLLISKGDPTWVQTVENHARCPGIESKDTQKLLVDQDGPRLMSTHLPMQLFPKSYFTSNAKIIYVIRNPKDVITSGYYIQNLLPLQKISQNFDEFLNCFIQGDVAFGSWFDHTFGWIKRRDMGSFLLMFYEELQKDLRGSVEKICQFLGKKLKPEELDGVLQNSSFSVMKKNRLSNCLTLRNSEDDTVLNIPLLRKGTLGFRYVEQLAQFLQGRISEDWKNHFTVAQREAFDKIYGEKMSSLDLDLFPWS